MSMKSTSYTDAQYLEFYRKLLLPRMIEERMLISLRQGKISKWFSAWGQEAISVGTTLAMNEDEYMLTKVNPKDSPKGAIAHFTSELKTIKSSV